MCVYYFNLKCDTFDAEDIEGQDCPTLEAARAEAIVAAGELIRGELALGELPTSGWIEVEDSTHRRVLRLPIQCAAS